MRYLIVEVVLASLLFFGGAAAFGAEVSEYEKACLDLGFKKRTPAYGECVLDNMKDVKTNAAANIINRACEDKFKKGNKEKKLRMLIFQQLIY